MLTTLSETIFSNMELFIRLFVLRHQNRIGYLRGKIDTSWILEELSYSVSIYPNIYGVKLCCVPLTLSTIYHLQLFRIRFPLRYCLNMLLFHLSTNFLLVSLVVWPMFIFTKIRDLSWRLVPLSVCLLNTDPIRKDISDTILRVLATILS